jgi:hypothetical protein
VPRKRAWDWDYGYANTSLLGTADAFGMKTLHRVVRGSVLIYLNLTFRVA